MFCLYVPITILQKKYTTTILHKVASTALVYCFVAIIIQRTLLHVIWSEVYSRQQDLIIIIIIIYSYVIAFFLCYKTHLLSNYVTTTRYYNYNEEIGFQRIRDILIKILFEIGVKMFTYYTLTHIH